MLAIILSKYEAGTYIYIFILACVALFIFLKIRKKNIEIDKKLNFLVEEVFNKMKNNPQLYPCDKIHHVFVTSSSAEFYFKNNVPYELTTTYDMTAYKQGKKVGRLARMIANRLNTVNNSDFVCVRDNEKVSYTTGTYISVGSDDGYGMRAVPEYSSYNVYRVIILKREDYQRNRDEAQMRTI